MKFSEKWLRQWVNPDITTDELAKQLTMAGLEVDAVEPVAGEFTGIVVGQVLSVEPHPQADRLVLCQISVDDDEQSPLSIVCGAKNLFVGMKVPVACIGATLPMGLKIKKTKLRGVVSEGMLCAASELGIADNSEGIWPLAEDAPLGEDLRDYLQLDDQSITVDLTPNRGDCLSIIGIAREVAALNQVDVQSQPNQSIPASIDDTFEVTISAPEACPRYVGRVIRGINSAARSPVWLKERLRRSDLRSIDAVVDVTNYVMLELGQPLHAFDLVQLEGGIEVRMAQNNESLTLLDGQQITLDEECLVISDHKNILAFAGIMGGEQSGVSATTKDVFLESAFFSPALIAGKARRFGLSTDSSHRFERGVDSQLQATAIERATELLLEIVGGQAGPIIDQQDHKHIPVTKVVSLRSTRVRRILGMDIADDDIVEMLQRLNMKVFKQGEVWEVQIPSHRFDIELEVDLIEEIARIVGYDNLPIRYPLAQLKMPDLPQNALDSKQVARVLVEHNYNEVITYSFVDPNLQQLLDPAGAKLNLVNPLSSELSQMRSNLWSGLLASLLYNQHRQQSRMQLFETGLRFVMDEQQQLQQQRMVAGVVVGSAFPEQWSMKSRDTDFFDVKGDVEALLALTGDSSSFAFEQASHPALHPGQCAQITRNGQALGWLGALHPKIEASLELIGPVYLFELQLEHLDPVVINTYQPLSKFPAIRRDLSFLIDQSVTAEQIKETIQQQAQQDFLQHIQLFDVYQGKGIPENKKSIAIGLVLQHPSRTLVDDEVNAFIDGIISGLQGAFDIAMRE